MKYLLLLILCNFALTFAENYARNVKFIVYKNNVPYKLSENEDPVEKNLCKRGDLLAVITHGWTEDCSKDYIVDLVSNLKVYRGGCIVCMDYGYYSNKFVLLYPTILPHFNGIVEALRQRMEAFRASGFKPSDTYMFGPSFGGRLVIHAGRLLKTKIKEIDVCEPTQVGFFGAPDSREAAENVQCIHTGAFFGTPKRNCHQDWNMGNCGLRQDVSGINILTDHIMCPIFYNSAFTNDFRAIKTPFECFKSKFLDLLDLSRTCMTYPPGFKMGYMQRDKKGVCGPSGGNLFAETTKKYPYN